ncbi:cuticle protein 67-like isoform X3 [Anthonomus grandis grandis]|uniref:cuticle protein 67-like isoform X3 n=1 Tax=Anthonomus grandis grandis TaxID=2921223 RepID=UPI0021658EF6|nr:cuticle protein 67-like isoform X3 [Anthonomus grandis grandis]
MAFRFMVLCATLALASAGNLLAPAAVSYSAAPALAYSAPLAYSTPAITSQSSNIYRTAGNLGQISTYSKTIDTPYSSVSKSDVRVSNPGLRIAAAPALAYSTPVAHAAYAAPVAYAAQAAYAAPVAHAAYAAPALAAPAYATSSSFATRSSLLGVAYSAAPAVAHVTYDNGFSRYAW